MTETMNNKWKELYEMIEMLHEHNERMNNTDVEMITRFLLEYMKVLDEYEKTQDTINKIYKGVRVD